MRIQHDTTLTMDLQVELALPHTGDAESAAAQIVVLPTGGDGGLGSLAHRWSFTAEEAEQLGGLLQDAARRARDMT